VRFFHARGSYLVAVVSRGVQLGLIGDVQPFDSIRVERMITCEVLPVGHALHAGLGHVDRLQPDLKFISPQAAQPATGRAAVTSAACGAGLAVIVLERGFSDVTVRCFQTSLAHRFGHQRLVKITASLCQLPGIFVNRRRDARDAPLIVDELFTLEPSPMVILAGGPVFGRLG
jgi:hypothetical protein